MSDFLLELLSEEIPARMQAKAQADLARLFSEQLAAAGLKAVGIETYATPRRLALIARGLPAETQAVSEEIKGPRSSAPPQALEGFLRKTGLAPEQLVERDGIFFAVIDKPGRKTADVLAEAIPQIIRAFPWPKSMRWGDASASTESLRWVRPLQGIVALFGEDIVIFEIAGIKSGAATVGHRFHHPGIITIGGAHDYAEKLRACHVLIDPAERQSIIRDGAAKAAAAAGLVVVPDEGLVVENAGLTEWPVPLLGSFDPAFLEVPREVIQLTMRTNQKYFACVNPPLRGEVAARRADGGVSASPETPAPLHHSASPNGPPPLDGEDQLAPNFICVANIEASDGGTAIVAGNERVLSARLSDAKFFWEQDLKVPLEEQAKKLGSIVFHEKLGTVADKVERVAKLARWLVEEGIVGGEGKAESVRVERSRDTLSSEGENSETEGLGSARRGPSTSLGTNGYVSSLPGQAETAARLCKADLVTGMVGEFPELQGLIGGYLARAQSHPAPIADAISDHYKPVGQGDEVPAAPVTVAVSLADKLDTIAAFFAIGEKPSGSRDPFALRRAALAIIALVVENGLRIQLTSLLLRGGARAVIRFTEKDALAAVEIIEKRLNLEAVSDRELRSLPGTQREPKVKSLTQLKGTVVDALDFFADRLKVQQREAGVRHDLIDAVFALGGEDDLVRLLARVKALQAFVETPEGTDLLAGYKRAANILRKEGFSPSPRRGEGRGEGVLTPSEPSDAEPPHPTLSPKGEGKELSYTPESEEAALIAALDSAEPKARAAVEAEDFEGAMAALASLREPIDRFFDKVTVNDPDPGKREARLDLLGRFREAVHAVADFSRIEG
ncbi:glycine--tRNA ligase subunit beta [Enterovirga sp. GCM10030262]|uniref:glycine--tRNA ligase subunit beta n=1 Tax=Enterovirga sp. GCM10030262 TaxID=3273391 RepID=UPI00361D74EA